MNNNHYEAIALFCEDIREEKSGAITLIGILPDNISVPNIPGMMPKLCIYVRIHVSVDECAGNYKIYLRSPSGKDVVLNEIDAELIEKTQKDAKGAGNPIAGIFSQLHLSPFPVQEEGRISLILENKGNQHIIGCLNFVVTKD